MIVQIVSAVFLKAGSEKLVGLILSLQIVAYLPLYRVDFPAELELYLNSIRKIAEFDIIDIEWVKKTIKADEWMEKGKGKKD